MARDYHLAWNNYARGLCLGNGYLVGKSRPGPGNGVGSIIADTGLIFGLTCFLTTVPMSQFILNRTGWVQVGATTLLVIISLIVGAILPGQPVMNRWVGFLLLFFLAGYMYITYVWAKQGGNTAIEGEQVDNSELASLGKCWLMIVGGLCLIVVGARILVPSAAEIGHRIGVPEDVIAATIVALGTSLPELMTAIAAIRKVHPEITVGNIVGADVLNCLFVIGAAAAARPLSIPPNFYSFHFPVMLIILYSFRYFIFRNKDGHFKITQGAWLLGVYLVYLILQDVLNISTVGK